MALKKINLLLKNNRLTKTISINILNFFLHLQQHTRMKNKTILYKTRFDTVR